MEAAAIALIGQNISMSDDPSRTIGATWRVHCQHKLERQATHVYVGSACVAVQQSHGCSRQDGPSGQTGGGTDDKGGSDVHRTSEDRTPTKCSTILPLHSKKCSISPKMDAVKQELDRMVE